MAKSSPSSNKGADHTSADANVSSVDLEKQGRLDPPLRQTSLSEARRTTSARSYAGSDGYTYFQHSDGPRPQRIEDEDKSTDECMIDWDGDDDPLDPRNKSNWRKWIIVLIVSSCATCVTAASSIYTTTYDQLMPELNISREVATVGLSLFVAGLGIGPMLLSPLSEFYGRRPIYLGSVFAFLIWLIPCAVADHTATLFVGRFMTGFAGSVFLSVAGGTVGDLFTGPSLSGPMMVYTSSPFIGPEVGPLIGGFISQYTDWRWTFYVMIIWTAVELALIVFFVPETYSPVILRQKAVSKRKETGNDKWIAQIEKDSKEKSLTDVILWSCIRPFQLLVLEPMVLNLCILCSLLLGIIYLWFGSFSLIFEDVYGFQLWGVGLSFLGMLIGMLLGVLADPIWKRNYIRLMKKLETEGAEPGATEPEFRLPPTIFGSILVPVGLFGFAWTTYPFVHWMVPIFFSGVFGVGTVWVYSGCFTFLVHSYPLYAASALAANSFARASFAAVFPLFGIQMYQTLGYNWASTLLGFLALVMSPFPYIFFRYGKRLRKRSKFAKA